MSQSSEVSFTCHKLLLHHQCLQRLHPLKDIANRQTAMHLTTKPLKRKPKRPALQKCPNPTTISFGQYCALSAAALLSASIASSALPKWTACTKQATMKKPSRKPMRQRHAASSALWLEPSEAPFMAFATHCQCVRQARFTTNRIRQMWHGTKQYGSQALEPLPS